MDSTVVDQIWEAIHRWLALPLASITTTDRRLLEQFVKQNIEDETIVGKSILFIQFTGSQLKVSIVDEQSSVQQSSLAVLKFVGTQTDSTEIRWVTDQEAIKHLASVLRNCTIGNEQILRTYRQLERFTDRPNVLEALIEERESFLQKITDWSETLLEYEESESWSESSLPVAELDNTIDREVAQDLSRMCSKVVTFKSHQKLVESILSNLFVLFSGVAGLLQYKENLSMTVQMLEEESSQLFHQWCNRVSSNIRYDLNKPCIIIDSQSHRPVITFSGQLEIFARHVHKFRDCGFEITADVQVIEKHVSAYVGYVRELRTIVQFYSTVADQILLSQRPMLIGKAKAFTNLLESKQSLTWKDGVDAIRSWIEQLKQFMESFVEENGQLKQIHGQVLETIKWIMDVPFDNWSRLIEKVRQIMEEVNAQYQNTLTWRKHWDYQLYKILEYYFNCLMVETKDGSRNLLTTFDQDSNQISKLWSTGGDKQKPPATVVELQFNPSGVIIFVPPIEQLKKEIFDKLQQFIRFPSTFNAFIDWSMDTGLNPEASQATRTLFHNVYYRNGEKFPLLYTNASVAIEELIQIRDQFRQWCSLYQMIKLIKSNDFTNNDGGTKQPAVKFHCETMEDYQHNLQLIKRLAGKFTQQYSMINEFKCRYSNYVVNIIPIKMFVEWLLSEAETVLLKLFKSQCDQELANIEQQCKGHNDLLERKVANIDELIELEKFVSEGLEAAHSNVMIDNITLREKIHFLKTWPSSMPLGARDLPNLEPTAAVVGQFENNYKQSKQLVESNRELLENKIQLVRSQTETEIGDFLNRWNKLTDDLKRMPEVINDFQVNCSQLMSSVRELRKCFEHFGTESPGSFGTIEQISNQIGQLYGKFHVLYEFEQGLTPYLEMEWIVCRNKLAKINDYIMDWIESHPTMDSILRDHVQDWKQLLAALELCRGDFYQQLHWKQFLSILEIDSNFEELKLNDLVLRRPALVENRSAILELNKRAFNDYSLRESLNELNQFAATGKFSLYSYQTKDNRQVMLIKDWSQCHNQISDCFLLIQTVKNIDPEEISDQYLQEYQEWESKLVQLESLVTLLNSVQRKWISLEPIYSSVSQTSSTIFTDQMFSRYSKDFQETMKLVRQNEAKYIQLLQVNSLESRLKTIDSNFNATQRKLRNFIEDSRQRFPRFYFLADEDLLLILSGKVDLNQSALVKKLFVNTVGRLVYKPGGGATESKVIESIESIQGELVRLRRPIRTDNTSGPLGIEKWLQELDSEIKSTLKTIFGEHLARVHSIYADLELLAILPSQLLGLYSWIDYTEKIEDSIQKQTLPELKIDYGRVLSQLTKTGQLQLLYECALKQSGDADQQRHLFMICKMKLKQIILDVIHFVSVIDTLLANGVRNCANWWWQSQLRFYRSAEAKVSIRMGLASFEYSFEYLGCLGDAKLVHTSLTNKCFLTLAQAMDLGLGGNPYGPAGTGKTESVKALGHHFGRQVLVFNCDEAIDVRSMTRILVGLVKCGSWGCFDEFNRLQLDVLSILSSQIQDIQHAIKTSSKQVNMAEYGQISIDTNAAIFITLNPAGKDYGGRNRIPDNLKSLFLPVAMSVPDNRAIVRFLLLAEGFTDRTAQDLGSTVADWFEMASGSMSRQKHYDWGLRAIKACVESSGRRLQQYFDSKQQNIDARFEMEIVIDTLRQQIKSKLIEEDVPKFDGLVEAIFGKVAYLTDEEQTMVENEKLDKAIRKAIVECNLLENNYQMEKIYQLQEMIETRFGVVLIGPSGCGKTTVWQILRKALSNLEEDCTKTLVNVTVINPKSLPRQKLFGCIDEDTREWNDGLFSQQSRSIARDEIADSVHWIVFDGDIDPDWVEALNSVLDDNRVLTLPSGERIDFDWNRCRILFETTSLQFASPATISRLGVVCIDDTMINEMVQCFVAKHQLSLDTLALADSFVKERTSTSKSNQLSTVRTLLEHLKYCEEHREDSHLAIERLDGTSGFGDHLETINTLVVTESVNKIVQLLKPLTEQHLCLIGPIGSGKCSIITEMILSTSGHLVTVNCTPSTEANSLISTLLSTCTTVLAGPTRTLRPNSGDHLWIFIRHFELLTLDKWLSNSLISLLILLLKHHGFYHPDTFEWISVEKFQLLITCTDQSAIDERLITSMHVVQVALPTVFEIEQILLAKAKLLQASLSDYFPAKFMDCVRLIQHEEGEPLNYLQIGIDILDTVQHYESISESIITYEIYRTLRGHIAHRKAIIEILDQLFEYGESVPTLLYTSLTGSEHFSSVELDSFKQNMMKMIRGYCSENDIPTSEWELLPQTVLLMAELCSFLSQTSQESAGSLQCLFLVGPSGIGRKYLSKVVAHSFGYDRIWTPNSILSSRHLANELRSLVTVDSSNQQKLLILVDVIHFEILDYLRDQLYSFVSSEPQLANPITIRLIITSDETSRLDQLMWLRGARLHRISPLSVDSFNKLTDKYLRSALGQLVVNFDNQINLFHQIFGHFETTKTSSVRYYTAYLKTFVDVFNRKWSMLHGDSDHLRLGVDKLDQVSGQVNRLKEEAYEQKQQLDSKRKEADEAFNLIMNSMHESEDKKVELEEVQQKIEVETVALKERKSKIDVELEQIEPILQAAKSAVGGIRSDALSEIRSLRAPPEVIRDILEGVLRLMGVNDTSWISMKTFLSKRGVKEDIMNFDCRKISPEIRTKVEQLLEKRSESFQPPVAKRASAAAALLAEWVKANVEYSKVLHKIGPLELELKKLESGMVKAQSRLKTLDLQLKGVDTEVDALRDRMQAVTVEAAQIELNLRKTSQVLEQSESLVSDLGSEHSRWTEQLEAIEAELQLLVQRCIVVTAYIVCACSEPSNTQRVQLLQSCFEKFAIEPFDLNRFTEVSSEEELFFTVPTNAIVPLICDPTHKASRYIDNPEYTRFKSSDWLKVLELGIRFGRTVIIDDFNQLYVGILALIFANIYGSSESRFWTYVGERKVDYNQKFRLYLLTDSIGSMNSRSLALFRVVNMSPSFDSITTQLLRHIINIKRPELEAEKEKVENNVRDLRKQLKQLEAELLEKLSAESGNILDNVQLIEQLKHLKSSASSVQQSLSESNQLREDLDCERKQYESIAQFAAKLYFSVENLPKLNSMYYVGYGEFEKLFQDVLRRNANNFTNDTLCYEFYAYVSQALFAEHRRTLRQYILGNFPQTSSKISSSNASMSRTVGEFITELCGEEGIQLALILTTPGADPTTEVQATIEKLGLQIKIISMGSDVLQSVVGLLQATGSTKQAICLFNLHLVVGWLPILQQHLQKLLASKSSSISMVILLSETCSQFPLNLLEMCTKFAYESMPGYRSHLRRLRAAVDSQTRNSMFHYLQSIHQRFHVICYERRYFIPFGWTKNYEISFNEYHFGHNVIGKLFQLDSKLTNDREQLCHYINGLFGDVIYGGKVDFHIDQLVLELLLSRCFTPEVGGEEPDGTDEFAALILPLNTEVYRNRTNEERLQSNLQLLQSNTIKMIDLKSKTPTTLQPSGIRYFRKLWKRILAKCKIDDIDRIGDGLTEPPTVDIGCESWNSLVVQFTRMQIDFINRLLIQVDRDLQSEDQQLQARLVSNQTPDSWQAYWIHGPEEAQNFLVNLARIYIRLTGDQPRTKTGQLIFDWTSCVHPKQLLNLLYQFCAKRLRVTIGQLHFENNWLDHDSDNLDSGTSDSVQAFFSGVWIEGALFTMERLEACAVDSSFTSQMPVLEFTITAKKPRPKTQTTVQRLLSVDLPLYVNGKRDSILTQLAVPCLSDSDEPTRWIEMGAAFVLGNFTPANKDRSEE